MPVEACLKRLPPNLRKRVKFPGEGDTHLTRTSCYLKTCVQICVDQRIVLLLTFTTLAGLHGKAMNAPLVDEDINLMRLMQSFHIFVKISHQT